MLLSMTDTGFNTRDTENDRLDRLNAELGADDSPVRLTDGTKTEWTLKERLIMILTLLYSEAFSDEEGNYDIAASEAFVRAGMVGLPAWQTFITTLMNEFSAQGGQPPAPASFTFGDNTVTFTREMGTLHTQLDVAGRSLSRVGYVPSPVLINWLYGACLTDPPIVPVKVGRR